MRVAIPSSSARTRSRRPSTVFQSVVTAWLLALPAGLLLAAPPATDHSTFFRDALADGPAVTRACLACHEESAREVMGTAHWRWEGRPVAIPGHTDSLRIGKRNLINNFCIGVQGNWPRCTVCHAGYGWEDDSFDFERQDAVDCLVCHEHTGSYVKDLAGQPLPDTDLLASARSVGRPTRQNCGACHFTGGGGNAVKHGDLDQTLLHPSERLDVHMGRYRFECVDCHKTHGHRIPGRAISVSVDAADHLNCTDCHAAGAHEDQRINAHENSLACQTCHIPRMAVDEATKMVWDWSTAGDQALEARIGDPHKYRAIKGSFEYGLNLAPEYAWFNGRASHYIIGDPIDPDSETVIAAPLGDAADPEAKIWPFKLHRGTQIYDAGFDRLIVPRTFGPGGYWTEFDWDKAARLGSESTGLPYSGEYGFARTVMYWPLSHMVAPKDKALQCVDCHGEDGRMDWRALGYPGDPVHFGGRRAAATGRAVR